MPHPQFSPATALLIHFVLEWLAVFIGIYCYRRQTRNRHHKAPLAVLIGCIAGAAIGNKLLFIIEVPQVVTDYGWAALLAGQTLVGGLLGGLLGVELAKKWLGVHISTGDYFVVPLAVAIIIGRFGCYLAGLHDNTFGIATTLPWGVNFGDGISRHPTQLYEQLAVLLIVAVLQWQKPLLARVPGLRFKLFLAAYLAWRLFIDFYKPLSFDYAGLSAIQWACALALLLYVPVILQSLKGLYHE